MRSNQMTGLFLFQHCMEADAWSYWNNGPENLETDTI